MKLLIIVVILDKWFVLIQQFYNKLKAILDALVLVKIIVFYQMIYGVNDGDTMKKIENIKDIKK